jgi:hypothetical protein
MNQTGLYEQLITRLVEQQQFALMCHYDYWDKTGKSLGFSDVPRSLLALRNTTLRNELSAIISILIERLEVSEFTMSKVNNSIIDSSSLNMCMFATQKSIF